MWRNILAFLLTVIAIPTALVSCGKTYNAEAMIGGGTIAHNHSSALSGGSSLAPATIAMTGTLSSTKACASGYTRVGPNFCKADTIITSFGIGPATACTVSPALTGVSDAKAVYVIYTTQIISVNAIGTDSLVWRLHGPTDSSCVTSIENRTYIIREMIATAGAAILWQGNESAINLSNSSGQFYYKGVSGTSGAGVTVSIVGYFD